LEEKLLQYLGKRIQYQIKWNFREFFYLCQADRRHGDRISLLPFFSK
jgi:hypothetical protein